MKTSDDIFSPGDILLALEAAAFQLLAAAIIYLIYRLAHRQFRWKHPPRNNFIFLMIIILTSGPIARCAAKLIN